MVEAIEVGIIRVFGTYCQFVANDRNNIKIEWYEYERCFNKNFLGREQIYIDGHKHSTSRHVFEVDRIAPMTVGCQEDNKTFTCCVVFEKWLRTKMKHSQRLKDFLIYILLEVKNVVRLAKFLLEF